MAAHAGERAWKTGTFVCQECNAEVRVKQGSVIPRCPNGHATYDERIGEPAGQRSRATSLGRRTAGRPRAAARTAGRSRKTAARAAPRRRPASRKAGSRAPASKARTAGSRKGSRSGGRARGSARKSRS